MVQFTLPKIQDHAKGRPGTGRPARPRRASTASIAGARTTATTRASTPIRSISATAARCPGCADLDQEQDRSDAHLPAGPAARRVCGSCAMNIDGTNTLACTQHMDDISGTVKIYPLPHMSVVKDLVPDMTNFYAQHASIKPWLQTVTPAPEKEWRQSHRDRQQLDGLYECILAPAARPLARATGGTSERYLGPPCCCRRIVDQGFARRGDRRAARRSRRIRSASTAATPS